MRFRRNLSSIVSRYHCKQNITVNCVQMMRFRPLRPCAVTLVKTNKVPAASLLFKARLISLSSDGRQLCVEESINTRMQFQGYQVRHNSTAPFYTFPLIVGVQDFLTGFHDFTGLPWWATIISTTIFFRLAITLPLAREQAITLAKTELIQPTINEILEALKHNIAIKGKRAGKSLEEVNREFRMEARLNLRDIYKREKCSPLKMYLLPWAQLPLWILISLALRNISGFFPKTPEQEGMSLCHPDLMNGGIGWITDLSISDPYFILPIIIGITNLLNIEMNTLRKKAPTKRQRIITRVFRTLTVAMVFFASQVPTAMSLYWATSSSYGLIQNLLLMQPPVRRALGIPRAPSESVTPLKDKMEILRLRLSQLMEIQRKS